MVLSLVGGAAVSALLVAQAPVRRTLDAYIIDVEGGEATLFVSPSGESLLVDTGWPGFEGRDADRILAAAKDAGITQIDHLVTTHYHADHSGGAAQLATRLPIRHFIDHGSNIGEDERSAYESYRVVRGDARWTEAKPGDMIPMKDVSVRVIASGGSVLRKPLEGDGTPNPHCAGFKPHGPDITSRAADGGDSRSVSLWLSFGQFKTVIMGDLTWNKEFELMCPTNPLGQVDVYLVSHHGSDTSGSAALVHALRPRAAIMNNGPRKGGAVQTFEITRAWSGLEDLWQNHHSVAGGRQHNAPEALVANLDEGGVAPNRPAGAAPVHMGPAHWIKLSAGRDGGFTIANSRTGASKSYAAPVPLAAGLTNS